ncbi:Chain length determinant protein [Pontibacter korlensis]
MRNAPDEVDLMVIFGYFRSLVRGLQNRIVYIGQAVRVHFLKVLFFTLIGLGVGYGIFYTTKPFYTSSMTLMLADIRNEFVEEQLSKLGQMVSDGNFEAVADRLDISTEAAKQIKDMQFSNLDQDRISEDSILTGSPFRIELSLYNSSVFNSMEPAIVSYLENNRYFLKQKSIRQRKVQDLIAKLNEEISSIDSVKSAAVTPRGPVNGFVYGAPLDPTTLYRESIKMFEERVKLEAELEQLDNIQVVSGFLPRSKPSGPDLLKHLLIGGGVSLLIGVVAAVWLDNKKQK